MLSSNLFWWILSLVYSFLFETTSAYHPSSPSGSSHSFSFILGKWDFFNRGDDKAETKNIRHHDICTHRLHTFMMPHALRMRHKSQSFATVVFPIELTFIVLFFSSERIASKMQRGLVRPAEVSQHAAVCMYTLCWHSLFPLCRHFYNDHSLRRCMVMPNLLFVN
jgi:hypothetical protein